MRETVLIVNDVEKDRSDVAEILRVAGFAVLSAGAWEEAMEVARLHAGPIRLLLSRVGMPGNTGTGLADTLRQTRPEMCAVFLSWLPGGEVLALHGGWTILQSAELATRLPVLVRATIEGSDANRSAILHALEVNVAALDRDGNIVTVNDAWRRFGEREGLCSANCEVGVNYLDVCERTEGADAEEAGEVAEGIRQVLRGEAERYVREYPCHSPTRQRWFRMAVTPVGESLGNGAVVMHIDITQRKLAELELEENRKNYLLLLNSTAEGIYGMDAEGRCTFCNTAAARLLGYQAPDELVGKPVHAEHHHSHADGTPYAAAECKIHQAVLTGKGTHADDEVFFRRDGKAFSVEYWSYPIRNEGTISGAVVTFLDISERRSLEAQFLQAQKMEAVGQLAGGVAHDFNNLLSVILGCNEILEEKLLAGDPRRTLTEQIAEAGRRGAALTRQLLLFASKKKERAAVANLNAVVRQMAGMLERLIGNGVRLHMEYDPKLPLAEADGALMEQVLMNLAVNARDAMPHGGDFFIQTSQAGDGRGEESDWVMLTARDTGHGMDAATRQRIFEPFFTTKEAGKGTGLGLSTVYGIVQQSRGRIEVESSPGEGATFRIRLPRAQGKDTGEAVTTAVREATGGSETILVLEDDPAVRGLIVRVLRMRGYTVLEGEDTESEVERMRHTGARIDLLVTDIRSREAAVRLQAMQPGLSILYLSAQPTRASETSGRNGHPTTITKPFTIEVLLHQVRAVLDGGRDRGQ